MTIGRRRSTRGAVLLLLVVCSVLLASVQGALAQATPDAAPTVEPCPDGVPEAADQEPNNQVPEAGKLAAAACVAGEMGEGDQDVFLWTLSEADAAKRWTLTVSGLPGQAIVLGVYRPEFGPDGTTIVNATKLLDRTVMPDRGPASLADLLWAPGTYVVGVGSSGPGPYRLLIAEGAPVPANGDAEPNDDATTATTVEGDFALAGDRNGSVDRYAWTLDEAAAAGAWRLDFQVRIGDRANLRLFAEDGRPLFDTYAGVDGRIALPDVGLAAGTYLIEISQTSPDSSPYVLVASPGEARAPDREDEPNDELAVAMPLPIAGPATTMTGRLATIGGEGLDFDYYRLTVDETLAGRQIDVKAFWQGGSQRRVCLNDGTDASLRCADGDRGVAFNDLILQQGEYAIVVSGEPRPDDPYLLRVDVTIDAVAGYETEPNDTQETAGPLDVSGAEPVAQGRFSGRETDDYRFTVASEPQLWLVVAEGTGIETLRAIDAAGQVVATASPDPTTGTAQIADLYLLPGDHWFEVVGVDGEYGLRLVPLGPPDPAFEREPNDALDRSQPLRVGETRFGRLLARGDTDVYRFTLLAEEHVTLRVEPPADGIVSLTLAWGNDEVVALRGRSPGEALVYEAVLPPGDYAVSAAGEQPSEERYAIALDRGDPFLLPDDAEPNDTPAGARPFPDDLTVTGRADGAAADVDWYLLPPLDEAGEARIEVDAGEDAQLRVEAIALATADAPETNLTITPGDAADLGGTVDLPAGRPVAVGIGGDGDYRLSIELDGAGGFGFGDLTNPSILPIDLTLTAPSAGVAAYWTDAQRVEAELTLTNAGDAPLDLLLDARLSNELWEVSLESTSVSLAAGESRTVPVRVRVAPDAWADQPVRVTIRAQDSEGAVRTAYLDVTPRQDAPPVNPEPGWMLPPELLGGQNVAWAGLGGQPVQPDPNLLPREAQLYDDLAVGANGWSIDAPGLAMASVELTVDLAGDEPIPVAGVVLNPYGQDGSVAERVRGFEVLLSLDGQTFETVYAGELSALPVDQAFVFAAPVEARYARLRILSGQEADATRLVLGEWKVIAVPGWSLPTAAVDATPALLPAQTDSTTPAGPQEPAAPAPDGAGYDLAAPVRGGHVVWMSPQFGTPNDTRELLVPGGDPLTLQAQAGGAAEWVIGFQHGRAAQIAALSWADAASTEPDAVRFETVALAVSRESPIGPWEPIGTWTLDRDDPESFVFRLEDPVWARYVRFTTTIPLREDANVTTNYPEYPAQIRVFERPVGEDYQSILGEWGEASRAAAYEWQYPPAPLALAADAGDTADEATELALDEPRTDSAWVGRDEDWYRIEAPAGTATLVFTLTGAPTVDVEVAVFDRDGNEVPVTVEGDSPRKRRYMVPVTPGEMYDVRVTEPPTSLVVAFDTSDSLTAYHPMIYQGLTRYAGAVVPGQEVVNFLPFEEGFLLPGWGDDPYALQQAVTNYPRTGRSSAAEQAQIEAVRALEGRPGTKAILLLSDAETSSYNRMGELWATFGAAEPRVFAVHLGAGSDPAAEQDFMEDWAAVNAGVYSYVRFQGDLDVAFDRAATSLRRPSIYGISVEATAPPPTPTPEPTSTPEPTPTPAATATTEPTSTPDPTNTPIPEPTEPPTPTPEPEPGYLRVVAPEQTGETGPAPVAAGVGVALIIDTSGSMLQPLEASTRADVAKAALIDLVTNTLPPGTDVSLRAFGVVPDSCETRLIVPQQPLDPAAMVPVIQGLEVVNLVKTPIGASLEAVAQDLGTTPGPKIVVLVTDGEETCGGDPAAAIEALVASGIDVRVNIVGFALDDEALKEQFEAWARLGNGQYIDAAGGAELGEAITRAVQPLYNVLDDQGNVVATGQVGGSSVRLPAGTYTVKVLTEPIRVYEGIVVPPGERVRFEMIEETAPAPAVVAGAVASGGYSAGWDEIAALAGVLGLATIGIGETTRRGRKVHS